MNAWIGQIDGAGEIEQVTFCLIERIEGQQGMQPLDAVAGMDGKPAGSLPDLFEQALNPAFGTIPAEQTRRICERYSMKGKEFASELARVRDADRDGSVGVVEHGGSFLSGCSDVAASSPLESSFRHKAVSRVVWNPR